MTKNNSNEILSYQIKLIEMEDENGELDDKVKELEKRDKEHMIHLKEKDQQLVVKV